MTLFRKFREKSRPCSWLDFGEDWFFGFSKFESEGGWDRLWLWGVSGWPDGLWLGWAELVGIEDFGIEETESEVFSPELSGRKVEGTGSLWPYLGN